MGKLLLPLLGGVPAIWNTCMFFFQSVLLLGYLYSHLLTRRFSVRHQVWVHTGVVLSVFLFLPLALSEQFIPRLEEGINPIFWLLVALTLTVGIPFFAVSTSAPLLQRWFSILPLHRSKDPYFLYASSNAGSFAGLLAFPFLLEPFLDNRAQGMLWAVGYGGFVLMLLGCGYLVRERGKAQTQVTALQLAPRSIYRLAGWVGVSFVPSSLLLSLTTYLSSEIGSVPLLWVIPLAIYLLSFVIVFSPRFPLVYEWASRWYGLLVLPLIVAISTGSTQPAVVVLPLHLATFFLATLIGHGKLARTRPDPRDLTTFYLCLSIGGALGGLFNAVVAPALFNQVWEYPLGLLAVAFLRLSFRKVSQTSSFRTDGLLAFLVGASVWVGSYFARWMEFGFGRAATILTFILPALICYSFVGRHRRFALSLSLIFVVGAFLPDERGDQLSVSRNFFGVLRVTRDPSQKFHQLVHGNTLHGRQFIEPAKHEVPLLYYSPTGPVGQIFEVLDNQPTAAVAVVGLGTGSMACYSKPNQRWDYFEIDPGVVKLATRSRYFTYMERCASQNSNVILGDARVMLKRAPTKHYTVMVVDAFSSDAIPVHLVTLEAMKLYLSKLTDEGFLAMHISNRYLDLKPVLAAHAQALGLRAYVRYDPPETDLSLGISTAEWVILLPETASNPDFSSDPRWESLENVSPKIQWTDQFSNPLSILK